MRLKYPTQQALDDDEIKSLLESLSQRNDYAQNMTRVGLKALFMKYDIEFFYYIRSFEINFLKRSYDLLRQFQQQLISFNQQDIVILSFELFRSQAFSALNKYWALIENGTIELKTQDLIRLLLSQWKTVQFFEDKKLIAKNQWPTQLSPGLEELKQKLFEALMIEIEKSQKIQQQWLSLRDILADPQWEGETDQGKVLIAIEEAEDFNQFVREMKVQQMNRDPKIFVEFEHNYGALAQQNDQNEEILLWLKDFSTRSGVDSYRINQVLQEVQMLQTLA